MFLILTLTLITFVSAIPPVQTNTIIDKGITIEVPIVETLKQNTNYRFGIHAHNSTNGLVLDNNTIDFCSLHIYNSTGNHLVSENMTFELPYDFELNVDGNNFSSAGMYAVLFYCEVTGEIGGFFEYGFEVTSTGTELNISRAIIFVALLGIMIFLFLITLGAMQLLPSENERGEEGELMGISNLKYFRSLLGALTYIWVMLIFFLSSNIALAYLGTEMFGNLLFMVYRLMLIFVLPFLVFYFMYLFARVLQDKEFKRLMDAGIREGI